MPAQKITSYDLRADETMTGDRFRFAGHMYIITETVPNNVSGMTVIRFYTPGTEPLDTLAYLSVRSNMPMTVFKYTPQ